MSLLVALLCPLPSSAEERLPVAYHGLRFLGIDAGDESRFQSIIRESLEQTKYLRLSFSSTTITNKCKGDVQCHCQVAREHQAARAFFGNIGRVGPIFTFELILVDTQSCAIENSVFISESHDMPSARKRMGELVSRLTVPLETLSETAVKSERDIETAPAIITVFTAKQIRQLGIMNICELFQLVPGFECIPANSGNYILHFASAGTLLFLLDGVPLSNPVDNAAKFSLNHIERVEFVRGPGSMFWGPNAFLGVVNIITKTPIDPSPRITAQARYGTLNSGDFFISAEQSHRWFRYFLSSTFNFDQGPSSFVADSIWAQIEEGPDAGKRIWGNSGYTQNEIDYYYTIIAKLEILRRLQFSVNFVRYKDYSEISFSDALLPPGIHNVQEKWDRLYRLSWEDKLGEGFKYHLLGTRYEHRWWEHLVEYPPSPQGSPNGIQYIQGNQTDPEVSHLLEGRLYHDYQNENWGSQALLGIAYFHQWMPDIYTTATEVTNPSTIPELDLDRHRFINLAGFFHEELRLGKWLFLSGGTRLEYRDPLGTAFTNQAGLIFHTSSWGTKFIYSEGYRPPDANSLYSKKGTKGNINLKPERSRALLFEAQTHWGPLQFKFGGARADLLELLRYQQFPHKDEDGFSGMVENKSSTTIWSAHGELRLEWPDWFSGFANYSWKTIDEEQPLGELGLGIPNAPHTISFGLSARPMNNLQIFATGFFYGARKVEIWNPDYPQSNSLEPVIVKELSPTINFNFGLWLNNIYKSLDVGLKIVNPFGFSYEVAQSYSGNVSGLIETRRISEILVTVRWSSTLDGAGADTANTWSPKPAPSAAPPETPTPDSVPQSPEQQLSP